MNLSRYHEVEIPEIFKLKKRKKIMKFTRKEQKKRKTVTKIKMLKDKNFTLYTMTCF